MATTSATPAPTAAATRHPAAGTTLCLPKYVVPDVYLCLLSYLSVQRKPVLVQDPATNISYLFVNEGDVYPGPANLTHSYVTIIDTTSATVRRHVMTLIIAPHLASQPAVGLQAHSV